MNAVITGIGSVTMHCLVRLKDYLSKVYINIEFQVYPVLLSPPLSAFDWNRMQYISDKLLEWLIEFKRKTLTDLVLGIGAIDAYTPGLNFVFGQAALGGGIALVFTPRLRLNADEELFFERLVKESMHELGHSFGLGHCTLANCVMSFSNSVVDVDRKKAKYCAKCARKLRSLGIIVSREYVLSEV